VLGSRAVRLYPIYHPAAALYTPRMLETLREDFARLPELLSMGPPEQPPPIEQLRPAEAPTDANRAGGEEAAAPAGSEGTPAAAPAPAPVEAEPDQLGLF
jgi:DNA polymerase